ncbi:MAG: hypothetical protein ACXVPP_06965 [Actinomycetota bacterium]
MDDQEILRQLDADDFQHDTPIVFPDPQQTVIEITFSWEALRLARAIHRSDDARLADPALPGCLSELDLLAQVIIALH